MKIHKKRNTILLIIISCALLLGGCGKEKQTADFSGVTSVCELATLKCYYHNVAKEEIDASGPFAKWFKTGYKKIWTEYSGIIEYGIDVSKVEVSEPDKDGVDTGFLTSITKEEETETLSGAQADMEAMAKENTELLAKAKTRAKTLLEEYVKNVGEGIGENYTVEWKDVE